jgi:hypothetical protein
VAGNAGGHSSPLVDDWIDTYRALFGQLDLHTAREQLGYQELLNLAATRTAGRQQRLSEDTPAIPTPLWVALIFVGCTAVALQIAMADPRERLGVHCPMIAAVTAAGLLVVYFLDHPYQPYTGGIQPSAMRQSLITIANLEPGLGPACSQTGAPV